MSVFWNVFWSIVAMASIVFLVIFVIDRTVFSKQMKELEIGMTGKDIESFTGKKLRIIAIDGNNYTAEVSSYLTVFRCRLIFINGRLASKTMR